MEFSTLWELVVRASDNYGDKESVIFNGYSHSYVDMLHDVIRVRQQLSLRNMSARHVALLGPNSYEWIVLYFALACEGIVLPVENGLEWRDIFTLCRQGDCEYVVNIGFDGDIFPSKISIVDGYSLLSDGLLSCDHPHSVPSSSATAILLPTSGTSGNNRLCMLSHEGLCADVQGVLSSVDCSGNTVAVLPFHHGYSILCSVLTSIAAGATIYVCEDIQKFKQTIRAAEPTHIFLVPAIIDSFAGDIHRAARKYIKKGETPDEAYNRAYSDVCALFGPQLRCLISGGAHLPVETEELLTDAGITILSGYGLSECSPVVSVNRLDFIKKGSIGKPIAGISVSIANPDERNEGEIVVSGKPVMKGYYHDNSFNEEVLVEGKLFTGDIGRVDDDGFIFISGRKKNIIVLSNGKNVMPEELEAGINGIPGVIESVVYADGDLVGATVVTYDNDDVRIKLDIWNKTLPMYKRIAHFTFTAEPLERNALKKIVRKKYNK